MRNPRTASSPEVTSPTFAGVTYRTVVRFDWDRDKYYLVSVLPRKEVIHPQLPLGMPCYDFAPIIDSTLISTKVEASGISDSLGVTGGVYKTRERIHRDIADSRLLAIPAS